MSVEETSEMEEWDGGRGRGGHSQYVSMGKWRNPRSAGKCLKLWDGSEMVDSRRGKNLTLHVGALKRTRRADGLRTRTTRGDQNTPWRV